jgi:hypothetical protein
MFEAMAAKKGKLSAVQMDWKVSNEKHGWWHHRFL